MTHHNGSIQESQLILKESSTGLADTAPTTKDVSTNLDTETDECIHHWIIESADKGRAWLDAQCKKCFEERKYKATMLTKYQPDKTKIKIESLDSIIEEETRRADKEEEPEW